MNASVKVTVTVPNASPAPPGFKRDWFFGLLLVLTVILVYSPVW